MYYSFYCNEKMVLDNWKYYQDKNNESNWLLKYLLAKDYDRTPEEMTEFYLNNRRQTDSLLRCFCEEGIMDGWDEAFDNYCNEEDDPYYLLRQSLTSDNMFVPREQLVIPGHLEMLHHIKKHDANLNNWFNYNRNYNHSFHVKLREIEKVDIYQSDIEFIRKAKKEHHLKNIEVEFIFGLIFFSRMYDSKWCRIGTEYKRKQFASCFPNILQKDCIEHIHEMSDKYGLFELWEQKKDEDVKDKFLYSDEIDLIYPNFDEKDKVAYTYNVTVKNNKLDLQKVCKRVLRDFKEKYCCCCGKKYKPMSNRQIYCKKCSQDREKENARKRKQKQREKGVQQSNNFSESNIQKSA